MNQIIPLVVSLLLISCAGTRGALLLAGGGELPPSFFKNSLALAAAAESKILIFPQASSRAEAGTEAAKLWTEAGADQVWIANLNKTQETRELIKEADILWFSGGSQLQLLERLQKAALIPAIQNRHQQGTVVGGTSAGAAAMGKIVISGNPEPGPYIPGAMARHQGLSLCPTLIIDQHFTQRKRNNRLTTAVIDNPSHLGIGISEGTILLIRGRTAKAIGKGPVHVFDGRQAKISNNKNQQAARGIHLSILQNGDSISW